jgi:subtilisin
MTSDVDPYQMLLEGWSASRVLDDPLATGDGVKVAVIDTGIQRSLITQRWPDAKPIPGVVFESGSVLPNEDDGRHSAPHGTTVADIMLRIAPQVQLYSADVFGKRGESDLDRLIAAMRHSLDVWKVQVIQLSVGIAEHQLTQPVKRLQLQRLIEEAYFRDVLVVAATHNEHPHQRSYPSSFGPLLFSVDKSLFASPNELKYLLNEPAEFVAHSRGYLGLFAREPATSWAAPHLSGFVARLLSRWPKLKPFEVKSMLYWMSQPHTETPDGC